MVGLWIRGRQWKEELDKADVIMLAVEGLARRKRTIINGPGDIDTVQKGKGAWQQRRVVGIDEDFH